MHKWISPLFLPIVVIVLAIMNGCASTEELSDVDASVANVRSQLYMDSANNNRSHKSYRYNRRFHNRFNKKLSK